MNDQVKLKQKTTKTSVKGFSKRRSMTNQFLESAYQGQAEAVADLLDRGMDIATFDPRTGMTALHLAVGGNHLDLVRLLVERGALFVPDNKGRMPTTIAAECEVSEELCDYIAEAEARAADV